ncbi:solute carrier family 22 member 11 isoform X2 [Panthera leo]|uniref:solute carrier family 22 member 11 isoform X2 n=1 Tax=Panthera leo TaxID=9689 RepID=UPI001C694812|nr:solute carrier family 22 member 11 isoform X2 [Panthera leo]
MAFTELLDRAGGVGLFQALQVFTLFLPSVLVPSHMLIENFSAAVPSHRCWVPLLDNSTAQAGVPGALGPKDLLTVSIPPGPNHEPHRCRRFRQPQWQLLDPNGTATNWSEAATEPCVDGWVYDRSTFTSTFVSEWDLVCDHKGLKPIGQSLYMTGLLIGSFCWGLLSNRFGRKWILNLCCLQVALANIGMIFVSHFFIYCGLRVLGAFAISGIILTSGMLLVEWTTTRRRAVTMTILGCIYSLGQMALGALAFTLRDWRALQLAVSTPFFAIFLICWWLPESARWLIITGKPEQGLQELHKVAKINGHKEATKSLTIEVLMTSMEEEMASAKGHRSVLELFLVPMLRWRTCIMSLVWMTADGFLQSVSHLGSVIDPLIRMTQHSLPLLVPVVYSALPITSGLLLLLFLPETQGFPLPDTIQDLENQKSAAATGNRREVVVTESTSF